MVYTKNTLAAVVCAAGFALTALPDAALAQGGTEGGAGIDVIIVTARKRPQTINEVPASLSVFAPDEIEYRGIRDMVDLGKFVPNLHISTFSAGNPAGANPVLRGIGIQDHLILTDPGVGVYVDGVYLGRQIGQHWSLSNIERVEVLRGPQGTLLGRNSIGGAINIVTRAPSLEPEARLALEAGTRERANLDLFGNIPLGQNAAVSFSGALKRRGGVGDFVNLPGAGWDVGELRDRSGRLTLLWRPADSLSLLLAADATSGRNGMNPYTTFIDELPGGSLFRTGLRNVDVSPDPYDNFSGEADLVEKSHQAHGWSLTAEWEASPDLTVKGIASRRNSRYRGGLDDDSTVLDFMSFPEVGEAGQTSLELQVSGERDALDFVAGLWAFREDGFNLQPDAVFAGGPTTFHVLQDTESEAVYASIGYRPVPALRISAGLRHTEDFKDARAVLNDFVDARSRRDWREWNWDLAATWQLRDRASVFANIANGYQAGQFPPRPYCLFGFIDVSRPGNVSAPNCFAAGDHITAVNHEIGFKGSLGGTPGSQRLAVSDELRQSAAFGQRYLGRGIRYAQRDRRPAQRGYRMGRPLRIAFPPQCRYANRLSRLKPGSRGHRPVVEPPLDDFGQSGMDTSTNGRQSRAARRLLTGATRCTANRRPIAGPGPNCLRENCSTSISAIGPRTRTGFSPCMAATSSMSATPMPH